MVKDENSLGDIVCFQITSNKNQNCILEINDADLLYSNLPLQSYVKYDKCFTLNSSIVDKKIATVDKNLLDKLKLYFCREIF